MAFAGLSRGWLGGQCVAGDVCGGMTAAASAVAVAEAGVARGDDAKERGRVAVNQVVGRVAQGRAKLRAAMSARAACSAA